MSLFYIVYHTLISTKTPLILFARKCVVRGYVYVFIMHFTKPSRSFVA